MSQSSAKLGLCGIIFNIYCTIIEDDSGLHDGLAINPKKKKKLQLHIRVSSRSQCGIEFNHSGSIRDSYYQNCVCV